MIDRETMLDNAHVCTVTNAIHQASQELFAGRKEREENPAEKQNIEKRLQLLEETH